MVRQGLFCLLMVYKALALNVMDLSLVKLIRHYEKYIYSYQHNYKGSRIADYNLILDRFNRKMNQISQT